MESPLLLRVLKNINPIEYLYGEDDRVLTLLELEDQITRREEGVINAQSLVMIQCVGCRQEDRNYCSRRVAAIKP